MLQLWKKHVVLTVILNLRIPQNGFKTFSVEAQHFSLNWDWGRVLDSDSFWSCCSSRALSFTLLLFCVSLPHVTICLRFCPVCWCLPVTWCTVLLSFVEAGHKGEIRSTWFDATDRPPNANAAEIFSSDNAVANMNQNHDFTRLIVQPCTEKIMLQSWIQARNVWHSFLWLWVELFPGGGNRKNWVYSTLPMPSSDESSTQQAVWMMSEYSVPGSTPLCSSCSHCHVFDECPPGGALCQRYYLVPWQLVCLEKEAIKMSLTEN